MLYETKPFKYGRGDYLGVVLILTVLIVDLVIKNINLIDRIVGLIVFGVLLIMSFRAAMRSVRVDIIRWRSRLLGQFYSTIDLALDPHDCQTVGVKFTQSPTLVIVGIHVKSRMIAKSCRIHREATVDVTAIAPGVLHNELTLKFSDGEQAQVAFCQNGKQMSDTNLSLRITSRVDDMRHIEISVLSIGERDPVVMTRKEA